MTRGGLNSTRGLMILISEIRSIQFVCTPISNRAFLITNRYLFQNWAFLLAPAKIKCIKQFFPTVHGIPESLVLRSSKIVKYLEIFDFNFLSSLPNYPSNELHTYQTYLSVTSKTKLSSWQHNICGMVQNKNNCLKSISWIEEYFGKK